MSSIDSVNNTQTTDARWCWLYKIAGAVSLLSFLYIPIQIFTFMSVPEPTTALGWFTLFQGSKIQGLMSFEFLFVVNAVLGITITLAFYVALRRVDETFMAIALVFGILGSMAIIVARPAIDMMYLSDQYAAATTEAQRVMFLTAGETLLAMRHGSAFHVGYVLASVNLVIIPLVMLRSKIFNKATAYIGIISGLMGFGLYVPGIGVLLSIISVVFMAVWDILIAIRLFQLGRGAA